MFARLTGSALLCHVDGVDYSYPLTRKNLVISAGYGREGRVPAYCDFYTSLMRAKIQRDYVAPSAKIQRMLDAIRHKQPLKDRNLRVNVEVYGTFVYLYDCPIAVIKGDKLALDHCGELKATTKRYLNAIAATFAGQNVTQRNGIWYLGIRSEERIFTSGLNYTNLI